MLHKLEKFIINDGISLEKLQVQLKQQNYLEILGVSHRELQHSNFLAWLLTPTSSHNIDNYFLKNFINLLPISPEKKIKINLSNLEETRVYREFQNIDLIIENKALKFVICIENKIYAGKSGSNQLIKYHETVENIWNDKTYKKYYVYLTPHLRVLTEEETNINYVNITYQSIVPLLEDILDNNLPSKSTVPLIESYLENLRKNILKNSKEVSLAQEIYRKHKTAIDFIVNNKPSFSGGDLFKKISTYFTENETYENLTPNNKSIIRILPKEVLSCFNYGVYSWDETDSLFAIEIFIESEKIWFKFCFGGIWLEDEDEANESQKIKDELFYTMKKFKSLKGKTTRSRPSSKYPSVANFTIMKTNDSKVFNNEDLLSTFIQKFEEFETRTLKEWTNEVLEKIDYYE